MKKVMDKLYKKDFNCFINELEKRILKEEKTMVVTANPEIIMKSESDNTLERMLLDSDVVCVADGIGVVKAYKMMGLGEDIFRIPGVEIVEKILSISNERKLHLCIFGSKQEVLDALLQDSKEKYPNVDIFAVNGYVKDRDAVMRDFATRNPDIILVALGVPLQEELIYKHLEQFEKGIFIGIGGSLDVLSGIKKRAPNIFIRLNLEWLYRILKEPKRIQRFYESNVKFIFQVKKEKRNIL